MSLVRIAYWFLSQQLGLDLRRLLRAPVGVFKYLRDLTKFSRTNRYKLRFQPCLHDWWEQAGAVGTEYFWQDLLVARMVHDASPRRHIDVGSRLDGFVAHVASFRQIEVFDVRPLDTQIPGVKFQQADMMKGDGLQAGIADSVSCLHAIEHFGLGRYGDPIQQDGTSLGIANLAKILEPGGTLYLSCPVGADEVFFNAHRALQPKTILAIAEGTGLSLSRCMLFNNGIKSFEEAPAPVSSYTAQQQHSLAIYVFVKAAGPGASSGAS
ncbi:MAG: DUF268 domain-containing protein [Betaproteobacteria bacterium]|jgi:hypothetical protein